MKKLPIQALNLPAMSALLLHLVLKMSLTGRLPCSILRKNFYFLYNMYNLSMTIKVHIILHHYPFYFTKMGKNFKDTNGELGETCHSTIKRFEKLKGYISNGNLSSDNALKTDHKSHSNFIALKMGSPSRSLAIRSPRSSPSSSPVRSRDQYIPVQKSF